MHCCVVQRHYQGVVIVVLLGRNSGFTIDSTWALPCIGFGSFLFIADSVNVPILLAHDSSASYLSLLFSVVLLACLVWWVSRRSWDTRWSLPVVVVSAICVSLYYVVSFFFPDVMQHPALLVVVELISVFGWAGLSFFWMVAILPLGSRRVCYVLTISITIFAFFCLLIFLFKDIAARMLLIVLPLLSAFCLQMFYRKRSEYFEVTNPAKDEISMQSQEYLGKKANHFVYVMGIVIPCFCGSAVLGIVHQMWPSSSMEAYQLFSAQMGLLVGAVVMAVLQLILVRFFWASTNAMFASVIVPIFLVDMLFISVYAPDWVTVYFALLLLVEKSLIAFGVYSTYMFRIGGNWITPWCIAFLSFHVGNFAGMTILHFFSLENPMLLLIFIVTFYVICVCIASLFFGTKITQAYEAHLTGGFDGESRFRSVVDELAACYGLTSRESEILAELGRGRNAAYIAERLTISPQTAKMHQKNIYAKMNLHSQQDLIKLIDQSIEDSRPK